MKTSHIDDIYFNVPKRIVKTMPLVMDGRRIKDQQGDEWDDWYIYWRNIQKHAPLMFDVCYDNSRSYADVENFLKNNSNGLYFVYNDNKYAVVYFQSEDDAFHLRLRFDAKQREWPPEECDVYEFDA